VSSSNNLFEDYAAFGTGRKNWETYGSGTKNNTCRRCWFRWEGQNQGGARGISLFYNSFGTKLENVLATWSGESQPESYIDNVEGTLRRNFGRSDDDKGVLSTDRIDASPPANCSNAAIYGSLVYVKGIRYHVDEIGKPIAGRSIVKIDNADCITLRHVYVIVDPEWSLFGTYRGIHLGLKRDGTAPSNSTASNLTSIRPSGRPDIIASGWEIAGHSQGTSPTAAGMPSPWTATSTGANLCKRWVNGKVTNEPLWPWPMNDRIKAATAAAGRYSGPCNGCPVLAHDPGRMARTATDVTANIEALLGTIPAQCKQ
jgi:hypothetical protein